MFEKVFPNEIVEVVGVKVDSGVSNQPIGDTETIQGATNHAKAALKKVNADFGIGEEGGMDEIDGQWFETG